MVKSETCTVTIPEYELTIPASRGKLTTVEGIIKDVIHDLSYNQPLRRIQDEDTYTKIQILIDKLKAIVLDENEDSEGGIVPTGAANPEVPMPHFTVELDDPTGNSFIEFRDSMASDPNWNFKTYRRTQEQNVSLGLVAADATGDSGTDEQHDDTTETVPDDPNEEIYVFPGVCSSCGHPLNTMMKKLVIPYFKVRFVVIGVPLLTCPAGCPNHVYQLRPLWLQGQRGKIGCSDVREGEAHHTSG